MLTLAYSADRVREAENRVQDFCLDIRERIRAHGYVCLDASNTIADRTDQFFFTAGLTESQLPELIVSGNISRRSALLLIERVVRELSKTKGQTPLGIRDDLIPGRVELRLIATPDTATPGEHAGMSQLLDELYPGRACVVQIIWADADRQLPDSTGGQATQCRQVVFPQLPFVTGTVCDAPASEEGVC
ncbi:hypothetical protein HDG34_003301 [Paraburkholderia sp. HC6.4b]|uniref:DUF4262 domain-containing protein n=1 Tax=unclassified Paraburkholderia TaxID=2615204 RepID=UPI00160FB711|nr:MULTISPECIES: DUF4262 domain-containing protein [unclassified Paraburkholderia]MBB5409360.1 hypothetical protein [Paraburkholderia sp. HC6.4b]MBB5451088.1 hypothetical protein [Paraburkholderia sp. Kb1A]